MRVLALLVAVIPAISVCCGKPIPERSINIILNQVFNSKLVKSLLEKELSEYNKDRGQKARLMGVSVKGKIARDEDDDDYATRSVTETPSTTNAHTPIRRTTTIHTYTVSVPTTRPVDVHATPLPKDSKTTAVEQGSTLTDTSTTKSTTTTIPSKRTRKPRTTTSMPRNGIIRKGHKAKKHKVVVVKTTASPVTTKWVYVGAGMTDTPLTSTITSTTTPTLSTPSSTSTTAVTLPTDTTTIPSTSTKTTAGLKSTPSTLSKLTELLSSTTAASTSTTVVSRHTSTVPTTSTSTETSSTPSLSSTAITKMTTVTKWSTTTERFTTLTNTSSSKVTTLPSTETSLTTNTPTWTSTRSTLTFTAATPPG